MLIALITYAVGILITIVVRPACDEIESEGRYADADMCKDLYGTIAASMFTLFQVMTLASWATELDRPYYAHVPVLRPLLVAFLALTAYGVMNIVIGVIVENTIHVLRTAVWRR